MATTDPATVLTRLAPLWTEELGLESVAPQDDFFALGGQSLSATRMIGRIVQEFGVSLRLRDVFNHPTLAALATHVAAAAGEPPRIRRVRRPTRGSRAYEVPLTPAQGSLWRVERVLAELALFNLVTQVDATGDLDVDLLAAALRSVAERHDVLRSTFGERDGTAVLTVHPDAAPPVERETSTAADRAGRDRVVREACARADREPFDLRTQTPIRARVITFSPTDHVLVVTTHHIAFDGWSRQLLVSDLAEAYRALAGGEPVPPRPGPRFSDYAAWQAERVSTGALASAVARLREHLAPPYPGLRIAGARPGGPAGTTTTHDVVLPAELSARVAETARTAGTTVFTVLLATFMSVLADRTGSDEARVAVKVANRELAETQGLIGQFDNTVIVRVGTSAPGELLGAVRAAVLDAYQYQDVPFEYVVDQLREDGEVDVSALLRVGFALQPAYLPEIPLPGGTLRYSVPTRGAPGRPKMETTTFDLVLELRPVENLLRGTLTYKTDVYDADTVAGFVDGYLDALAAHPAAPAGAA